MKLKSYFTLVCEGLLQTELFLAINTNLLIKWHYSRPLVSVLLSCCDAYLRVQILPLLCGITFHVLQSTFPVNHTECVSTESCSHSKCQYKMLQTFLPASLLRPVCNRFVAFYIFHSKSK